MATTFPTHEFSPRVPWVLMLAVILIPILATIGVLFLGPGK
jgi:hypothetical protein